MPFEPKNFRDLNHKEKIELLEAMEEDFKKESIYNFLKYSTDEEPFIFRGIALII